MVGLFVLYRSIEKLDIYTSTDSYCISCHVHTPADHSWELSSHYSTDSFKRTACVDCHLPPKESIDYWPQKIKAGTRDLYSYYFKDRVKINWAEKSEIENAVRFTPKESCINCHENLFPFSLSDKGEKAHLYYRRNADELHCINCHIGVGHGQHRAIYGQNTSLLKKTTLDSMALFTEANKITRFINFKEQIPGSDVSFDMIAIPAGEFEMAIYPNNKFNSKPLVRKKIELSPFFMAKVELTWDAYLVFLRDVESEGREQTQALDSLETDVISGATPPWGDPSQGWGMGQRPAITMTHHAAQVYCQWLSKVTGKNYRLPSEAEWEYAAREGAHSASSIPSIEKADAAIYKNNAHGKTQLPQQVQANGLGLKNMLGNVKEFCQDTYDPTGYYNDPGPLTNPLFQAANQEHVVRGGSFKSTKSQISPFQRDHTFHDDWLKTDPQIPKSIWWYSDCNDVGFRVVCEIQK